jgi:NAD(P)H dehydrogenase (quinone)
MVAGLDVAASRGELDGDGRTLGKLIGRPTTTLADAVKAAL